MRIRILVPYNVVLHRVCGSCARKLGVNLGAKRERLHVRLLVSHVDERMGQRHVYREPDKGEHERLGRIQQLYGQQHGER